MKKLILLFISLISAGPILAAEAEKEQKISHAALISADTAAVAATNAGPGPNIPTALAEEYIPLDIRLKSHPHLGDRYSSQNIYILKEVLNSAAENSAGAGANTDEREVI